MTLLDTFQSVRKLRDNGASEPLAEAIVEVAQDAAEAATDDLATKADLARLETATKTEFAELKTVIAEFKNDIYRALLILASFIVATAGVSLAIAAFFFN